MDKNHPIWQSKYYNKKFNFTTVNIIIQVSWNIKKKIFCTTPIIMYFHLYFQHPLTTQSKFIHFKFSTRSFFWINIKEAIISPYYLCRNALCTLMQFTIIWVVNKQIHNNLTYLKYRVLKKDMSIDNIKA